jgi:hypothetical protein
MYKRVMTEEGQGLSQTDFDRFGSYPQDGAAFSTRDLLTSGLVYAGFQTTTSDSVTVQAAVGRIYDGGRQYASEDVQERSVAAYVPVTAGLSVICLLVGQGQEISDDQEDRYYETPIDPQNPSAGTQQTVESAYRTKYRKAVLTIIPGVEGARPMAPAAPIGSVAIAEILITTSGIQSVTMRTDTLARRLDLVAAQQATIIDQLALVNANIDGLRADLAGIKAGLLSSASQSAIAALQVDLALVKDSLDLPDDGSPYWADRFLDLLETDTAHVDYDARVDEGVRFDYFNKAEFALSLYNPNDPNLMHAAAGLICPKYVNVDGVSVAAKTAEMLLGGTVAQAITVQHLTESRQRIRYGTAFTVCNNSAFWKSGKYDPIAGIFTDDQGNTYKAAAELSGWEGAGGGAVNHQYVRLQQFWVDTVQVPYDAYSVSEETINGVVKAQTFLQHQERWASRAWLGITSWEAGAEITAVLCECRADGTPDTDRVLAKVTKGAADFAAWPNHTNFTFGSPVFLQPLSAGGGKARPYALVFFTTGTIYVATADGQSFLGGNLFTTSDGVYYLGDLTKDICFGLDFCSFAVTQTSIQLGSWNLAGGIEDIDILAPMIVPSAANAIFEVNIGGTWRALSAAESDSGMITGLEPLYSARVTLMGTQWAMPIIGMGDSRVRLSRGKDSFVWIGPGDDDGVDGWSIGATASEIKLKLVVGAWDVAHHTLIAKCLSGAGFATSVTAGAPTTRVVPGREVARPDQESAVEMEFTFTLPTTPDTVKFRLEGDTTNYRVPFHIEWAAARKTA